MILFYTPTEKFLEIGNKSFDLLRGETVKDKMIQQAKNKNLELPLREEKKGEKYRSIETKELKEKEEEKPENNRRKKVDVLTLVGGLGFIGTIIGLPIVGYGFLADNTLLAHGGTLLTCLFYLPAAFYGFIESLKMKKEGKLVDEEGKPINIKKEGAFLMTVTSGTAWAYSGMVNNFFLGYTSGVLFLISNVTYFLSDYEFWLEKIKGIKSKLDTSFKNLLKTDLR